MSGRSGSQIPSDPEGRDALAGEYVLGTLDARTAAAVTVAMRTDRELRSAVAAWEARLSPLTRLATPEAPPPDLWSRIDARIASAMPQRKPPVAARLSWLWRGWAVGATLAAAALAVVAFLPTPPETRFMTVLVTDRSQPAWIAEVDRAGGLRLAAVAAAGGARADQTPQDRVMQLWALPPNAAKPTSLGIMPRDGGTVSIPAPAVRPVPGMLIEISLEPPGGSPTGLPTGPVLFIGRLSPAGPNT